MNYHAKDRKEGRPGVLINGSFVAHEAREAVREFFRPITASIERVLRSTGQPRVRRDDLQSESRAARK